MNDMVSAMYTPKSTVEQKQIGLKGISEIHSAYFTVKQKWFYSDSPQQDAAAAFPEQGLDSAARAALNSAVIVGFCNQNSFHMPRCCCSESHTILGKKLVFP